MKNLQIICIEKIMSNHACLLASKDLPDQIKTSIKEYFNNQFMQKSRRLNRINFLLFAQEHHPLAKEYMIENASNINQELYEMSCLKSSVENLI